MTSVVAAADRCYNQCYNNPHPNASKLFFNWVLTKEGPNAWTQPLVSNSRRTDVPPGEQAAIPGPNIKWIYGWKDDTIKLQNDTRQWLATLVS